MQIIRYKSLIKQANNRMDLTEKRIVCAALNGSDLISLTKVENISSLPLKRMQQRVYRNDAYLIVGPIFFNSLRHTTRFSLIAVYIYGCTRLG